MKHTMTTFCPRYGSEYFRMRTPKHRQWMWYAIDRKSSVVERWHNGNRGNCSLKQLLEKLSIFPIRSYSTDDWHSYSSLLPPKEHRIGKDQTWQIERKNLNFRTHIKRLQRKTICFSKNVQMHDNLIGMYIERNYYNKGTFS